MTLTWHAYAIKSRHIRRCRPSFSSAIWRPCWQKRLVLNLHIWRWRTTAFHALLVQFSFYIFSRRSRSFHDLILCARREFMPTNIQFNSCKVRTHFSHVMALNNWEMIAERRSYIFRWCSRRRRLCLSSLAKNGARAIPLGESRGRSSHNHKSNLLAKNQFQLKTGVAGEKPLGVELWINKLNPGIAWSPESRPGHIVTSRVPWALRQPSFLWLSWSYTWMKQKRNYVARTSAKNPGTLGHQSLSSHEAQTHFA